jgi:sigma-B regulation protein RsbU (phosphoserine phosphatase)
MPRSPLARTVPGVASVEGDELSTTAAQRLRGIESITDVALVHLEVEDLLDELLVRVREILDVDTAAVLLFDRVAGVLVATAASGIEEEVRQGVRIPIGVGFAGRIAAEVAPMVIEDIDKADVYNPILREKGIRSLLGAPLVTENRVMGVIHVGSLSTRRFTTTDIELLQMVAARVALAVDARRSNVERAAASALQHSLIPTRLPRISGLDLAARYLPAHDGGVGGDWYDVFILPDGHVGVVIGDVVGRGLAAAVVMGRVRSALRAYALEFPDPAVVLERLDRKVQHFETGQMTTVLYGVIDPTLTTIEISSAGHPLPMLAVPGSEAAMIDVAVDPPVGVVAARSRHTTAFDLPVGSVLALYTDGLVERRGEPLDCGLARLRAAFTIGQADTCCRTAVAALMPNAGWTDDAALLIIRRRDAT